MMHQFDKMPASFEDDVIKYLYKLSEMYNFTAKELEAYKKSLDMNWDIKNIEDFAHEKGYNEGHAEGRSEGIAEGEVKAQTEMARKMLAAGMPLEQIMQFTGLDAEAVEALTAVQ